MAHKGSLKVGQVLEWCATPALSKLSRQPGIAIASSCAASMVLLWNTFSRYDSCHRIHVPIVQCIYMYMYMVHDAQCTPETVAFFSYK